MVQKPTEHITELIGKIGEGDAQAADELLPLVYDELRRLSRSRLARERREDAQPTSLVHDAYLRLIGDADYRWENRAHFFAAAGEAMRRIVIERARRRARQRHGGGQVRVTLDDDQVAGHPLRPAELLALDAALSRLELHDRSLSDVVKLRYFGGMTVPETARALDLSPRTVDRQWAAARAWLDAELSDR